MPCFLRMKQELTLIMHSIDQSLFARRTIAAIAADADPPPGADDRDPKL